MRAEVFGRTHRPNDAKRTTECVSHHLFVREAMSDEGGGDMHSRSTRSVRGVDNAKPPRVAGATHGHAIHSPRGPLGGGAPTKKKPARLLGTRVGTLSITLDIPQ